MFKKNIFNESIAFNKLSWLRLARSANVGAKTFWDLIRIYKTPTAALEQIPYLSSRGGRKTEAIASNIVEDELKKAVDFGAELICAYEDTYPQALKEIPDAPPVITALGKKELLQTKDKIAIVGSRSASANSCKLTLSMAKDLGKAGYIIVSGLAKGVDAAAHQGALTTGTIGVIASGIDHIYPLENKKIYNQLYELGVVVTEFPFGSPPVPKHFPQRNRVISGLSKAVLVIEAALRSGSLITANFALDQGREVFAVPGSPMDPRCQGSNSLIKQGAAHLLETAEDVLKVLSEVEQSVLQLLEPSNMQFDSISSISERELEKWRDKIIEKLSYSPTETEEVIKQTGVPAAILNRVIIELELAGIAERLYGQKIVLYHFPLII